MTLTLWGTDTLQHNPFKHLALSKQTEYTLPNIAANTANVYHYSNLKIFFGHAFCKQALSNDIGTLNNFSSSPQLCDAGNLLVSNLLFSQIETINDQFTLLRTPSTLEGPSSVELAIPPPGDCPLLEALAKDLADPDKGPALNAYLDEFLNPNSVRVKAWKKINASGISDFISQPGYIKTLEKIAKYQDEAATGSTGTVKYYRVQTEHPDSKILEVETNGNLTFNKPDVNLNISTTTREHADYYAAQKIAQGNTVGIIEFEVPKAFDIQMKQTAVPQYKSSQNLLNPNGTAPKIVDPLQPGDPFELPGFWNQLVQQNYITGTAKIVN